MKGSLHYNFIFILIFFAGLFSFLHVFAADTAVVNATVSTSVCGNNIKEGGESCDGTDLAGRSCSSFGFSSGTLTCSPSCDFNATLCTGSASIGGGGGGDNNFTEVTTQATFRGLAYPGSLVTITKDGLAVATTPASPDARFEVTIAGLHTGSYIFGVSAKDKNGLSSTLQTFPITMTTGISTVTSGIFIPPTISIDKSEVKQGDILTILGQTVPSAEVSVLIHSSVLHTQKIVADDAGAWFYKLDTTSLEQGDHTAQARAKNNQDMTNLSSTVSFSVGTVSLPPLPPDFKAHDLNDDNKIDIVDFSVETYWYKKSSPPKTLDFNNDGTVDLIDLSIMAYYWTG